MKVPKYIQDMMRRSKYIYGRGDPGYTIEIEKATCYTTIHTFIKEIGKLEKWVNRQMPKPMEEEIDFYVPTIIIDEMPKETRHDMQSAVVTIYDPVMKYLEPYIGNEKVRKWK